MSEAPLTPMLLVAVANLANIKRCIKTWVVVETLARGYSYENAQWELSSEYQRDRV